MSRILLLSPYPSMLSAFPLCSSLTAFAFFLFECFLLSDDFKADQVKILHWSTIRNWRLNRQTERIREREREKEEATAAAAAAVAAAVATAICVALLKCFPARSIFFSSVVAACDLCKSFCSLFFLWLKTNVALMLRSSGPVLLVARCQLPVAGFSCFSFPAASDSSSSSSSSTNNNNCHATSC